MSSSTPNRVRERREALGLSQSTLGAAASLTRQSVSAIEAGRAVPGVDVALRIAKALDCRVEDLFGETTSEGRVETEPFGRIADGRVALAQLGRRWVSYPLTGAGARTSADGLVVHATRARVEVEPVRPLAEARENLVVMGCAAALGLLADRLNSRPGAGRFLWFPASSTSALEALGNERAHIAGVHLVDARTGEANVVDVRRHVDSHVTLVTLGRWEAGLVVARGNPSKIRRVEDLGRKGTRIVTRETGSGARRLLDRELCEAGLIDRLASDAFVQASGHLEVAHAVSMGAADAGIATRDAAILHGLDFVPLAEERYDLVVPSASMEDPRVARLLEVMTAGPMRQELAALGYDVSASGDRVADVHAA